MTPIPHTPSPRHILIFEPLSGGHRAEFIGHLLEHIRRVEPNDRTYTFVIAKGHEGSLSVPSGVSLREIDSSQEQVLARSTGPLGGFATWRILKSYLNELKPDHVILMDLTWLELPLCFRKPPCPFSGILFVQYPELKSGARSGVRQRLKFWMKEIKTRLFLRNPMLRRIFLLNGAFSCDYLNRRFNVSCYMPVPDPVPLIAADSDVQLHREFGIEAGRCIFLFFGSMSARKGVELLADAIGSLSKEATQNSAFIFCGMPEPDFAEQYQELVSNLLAQRPDVCLHIEKRFVSSARMRALFEQADWILMPYNRPEYSSGILAHAAAAQTPVIGPSGGLIGRLIREHKLGIGVAPDALGSAMEYAADEDLAVNERARKAFVDASNPEAFAAALLDEWFVPSLTTGAKGGA